MRSGLAWKFSRSDRSTVILRKPKWVVGKTWLTTTSSSPFFRRPFVTCSLVIMSMPPDPQQGSQTVQTTPRRRIRFRSPASIRSTIRCTTSRGVKCSPGFSLSASLNFRISSSKIVPIVGLSTRSGCRSTFLNRSSTWKRSPASSSLLIVLSKSNLSSTSRMFGLNPAM